MEQGKLVTMTSRLLTQFEHILLGMICLQPSSGYDLKRTFAVTPMGVYQPSSGALYPALRRLEQAGLVRVQADQRSGREAGRARHVYEPTPPGQAAHAGWLRAAVEPALVARDLGLHLMRFVMMEHQLPRAEVLAFLHDLAGALAAFVAGMEQYAASGADEPQHAALAIQHGLVTYRASLRWTEETIAALSVRTPTSGRRPGQEEASAGAESAAG
jgi:PadR family transcriptional regulator, regulatory protein AphA